MSILAFPALRLSTLRRSAALLDEAQAVLGQDREENKHRPAEHQPFGHETPLSAIRALSAVVAQAEIVPRLNVEDVSLRLIGGWVVARVVHVAMELDVLNADHAL